MEFLIGLAIGLAVGWFVLPRPAWASALWAKLFTTPAPVAPAPLVNSTPVSNTANTASK